MSCPFSGRSDLVRSYLERDVLMFAPRIPTETLRRLWMMLAHHSGRLLNASDLARRWVSGPTVDRHIDLLVDLAGAAAAVAAGVNVAKRVTKAPKAWCVTPACSTPC